MQVGFEWLFMVAVLICNASKLICFLCTLRVKRSPLTTIGDAMASFLSYPNVNAQSHDPITVTDLRKRRRINTKTSKSRWLRVANKLDCFYRSASKLRWMMTILACIILLSISLRLLAYNAYHPREFQWGLGQSAQSASNFVEFEVHILTGTLLANSPQFLISCVYVSPSPSVNTCYTNYLTSCYTMAY